MGTERFIHEKCRNGDEGDKSVGKRVWACACQPSIGKWSQADP